jgi:hypothetical protein
MWCLNRQKVLIMAWGIQRWFVKGLRGKSFFPVPACRLLLLSTKIDSDRRPFKYYFALPRYAAGDDPASSEHLEPGGTQA